MLTTPTRYAQQHNIRPQIVYQWIRKQGAPSKHISGKFFVDTDSLDKWCKEREEAKSSEALRTKLEALPTATTVEVCANCMGPTTRVHQLGSDAAGPYVASACEQCGLCACLRPISPEDFEAVCAGKKELLEVVRSLS